MFEFAVVDFNSCSTGCHCSIKFLCHCIPSNNLTNALESRAKMTSFQFPFLDFSLCTHFQQLYEAQCFIYISIEYTNVCQINQHQLHTFNQSSVFSKWRYPHHMKRTKIFHSQWQNAHAVFYHFVCDVCWFFLYSPIYSEKSQNDIHSGFYSESFCVMFCINLRMFSSK